MPEEKKKKESLFKKDKGQLTFGFFDFAEYEAKPTPKSFPLHMDYHMATFGDKDDEKSFSGNIQGGIVGLVVNIDKGNTYRITIQQVLDFVVAMEEAKGNPLVQDEGDEEE